MLRHSAAHLMAMAVLDLFPGTDLGFGPATDDGFYYDFKPPVPFQEGDLPRIEARMREIAKESRPYARTETSKGDAKARLGRIGYLLKIPHIDEIPEDAISFYDSGGFTDMCEGPHVPDTSWLRRSGSSPSPAPTGAATRRGSRCSGSTGPPSSRRKSSTRT